MLKQPSLFIEPPQCSQLVLPSEPGLTDVWHSPTSKSDYWGPIGHGLDDDEAERLWPIYWKQQCGGATIKRLLFVIANLTDKLDMWFLE